MIDIVIPVHNATEHFCAAVDSIDAYTGQDHRFIFVDDFSTPDQSEVIREVASKHKNSLLVRTSKQRWFTRACNIGLRLVNSDWAVLINSDCTVGPGWLEHLEAVRAEYEGSPHFRRLGLIGHHGAGENTPRWDEQHEPSYVTGHCLFLCMAAMWEVANHRGTPLKVFDETRQDAIHINSDRFLSYDLNKLGFAPIYAYGDYVGHHGGKSWGHNLALVMCIQMKDVND